MYRLAKKLALRSTHRQHHHAVIITRGGAQIAYGYNHGERHAEVMALKQLFPDDAKGCTLWSFRWRKNGSWGMALPCQECQRIISFMKVKRVFYTDVNGKLVKL
jgi:deoxycytidylate deaminase